MALQLKYILYACMIGVFHLGGCMARLFAGLLVLIPCFLLGATGYVTNFGNDTVSAFDIETNTVTDVYGVGSGPAGIAISGNFVYVANSAENTVSIIDTKTGVVSSVTVDYGPTYIAIDGQFAYVANMFGATMGSTGSVSLIDTTNNAFVTTIYDASFDGPAAIAFRGGYAYVANFGAGESGSGRTVSVIDLASRMVSAVTPPFTLPSEGLDGIAINGLYAYTTNYWSPGNVSIVDLTLNEEVGTIDDSVLFSSPADIAISGGYAYVTNDNSTVLKIDLSDQAIIRTIGVGNNPTGISIYGTSAYVANLGSNSVSIIDLATDTVSLLSDIEGTLDSPKYIAVPSILPSRAFGRPNNRR